MPLRRRRGQLRDPQAATMVSLQGKRGCLRLDHRRPPSPAGCAATPGSGRVAVAQGDASSPDVATGSKLRRPPKNHCWDARGIRDGVRVQWPPGCAGSSGALPASTMIAPSSPGAPVGRQLDRRCTRPPKSRLTGHGGVLRLDPGDHASALQARFGCLQIPSYTPLTRGPVGQKAEATGQYRTAIPTPL